jgi:hypothetical protein
MTTKTSRWDLEIAATALCVLSNATWRTPEGTTVWLRTISSPTKDRTDQLKELKSPVVRIPLPKSDTTGTNDTIPMCPKTPFNTSLKVHINMVTTAQMTVSVCWDTHCPPL